MKSGAVGVTVVIPMKPVAQGKSRLDDVLDPPSRAALSLLLLGHVIQASRRSDLTGDHYVVGGDAWVQRLAESESCRWRPDSGGGLNDAASLGAQTAFGDGAKAMLLLPGDLGLLVTEDVDALIQASKGLTRAVLSAAVRDGGTNAVLAPQGSAFTPLFGPDSFVRHRKAMLQAGTPVGSIERPGLGFDLDTPEDLAYYQSLRPDLANLMEPLRRELAATMMSHSQHHERKPV